jgi:hypothetical protein
MQEKRGAGTVSPRYGVIAKAAMFRLLRAIVAMYVVTFLIQRSLI